MNPSTNIYLAFTPYHILLCACIASERPSDRNIMVVQCDSPGMQAILKLWAGWDYSPFTVARTLPFSPGIGNHGRLQRRIGSGRNISTLRQIIREERPSSCWTCNDTELLGQSLFHFCKKFNKRAVCGYLEDGANVYSGYLMHSASRLRELFCGLTHGVPAYRSARLNGASSVIDERRALFPALVRSELRRFQWRAVAPDFVRSERFGLFGDNCIKAYGLSGIEDQYDVLFLANGEDSLAVTPNLKTVSNEVLRSLVKEGGRVAVKYHPRSGNGDYLNVRGMDGVGIVPSNVPLEMVLLASRSRWKTIVGGTTSVLMMVKWALQNVRVLSFLNHLQYHDEPLVAAFRSCGIEPWNEGSQIRLSLDQNDEVPII